MQMSVIDQVSNPIAAGALWNRHDVTQIKDKYLNLNDCRWYNREIELILLY